MGLLRKAISLSRRLWRRKPSSHLPDGAAGLRICRFEQMERRQLLAVSPVQIGMVYFEDAAGEDQDGGDRFEITWSGGAPGTQLTQLSIATDKLGDGLTIGDVFFDTASGGLGAFGSDPLVVRQHAGIDSVQTSVSDGGTTLVFTFTGFDPGEKLVFTVDVDEMGFLGPNAVAEGNEFEGSMLHATFAAPHFYDAAGGDMFIDAYDAKLAGSGLPLPPDSYVPPGSEPRPVYTAAAIFSLQQNPLPITLSGTVFEDIDLDNTRDPGDAGIAGVHLELLRLEGGQYTSTGKTAVTDAAGQYKFEGVAPGTYRVVEAQPSGYFSIGARAGTVGGQTRGTVLSVDVLDGIELLGGDDSVRNDFAEARPATLRGHVYHDADNDGVRDPGETGIAGATVRVQYLPPNGPAPSPIEVVTGADGSWAAVGLMPGDYRVDEIQPPGYLDGLDAAGTAGGTAHNPGDLIDGIHLASGQEGVEYNFGEIRPSTISGHVIADANANGQFDPGDSLLAGVVVELLDAGGNVLKTTQTNAQGYYEFTGLAPGVYALHEIQPQGYFDGPDKVGSAGGTLQPPDSITSITLVSGTAGVNYDFYEYLPSRISGQVIADLNGNDVFDPGDRPIAGVTVELLDADGKVLATQTTDANGQYAFTGLAPGVYAVHEVQPEGYFDSSDHVGTAGGGLQPPDSIVGIRLVSGTAGEHYDFYEILPSSISGRVIADRNGNCRFDAGDKLLEGVTVRLHDGSGKIIATTQTDSKGEYSFTGLAPGLYTVEEIQPEGYYDGGDHVGTAGGALEPPDAITGIRLISGTVGEHYDFCELEPVSISGHVYADDNDNGVRDPGEAPIAGALITLLDASGKSTGRTTVTDAQGFYRFDGLEPGVYGVAEAQPSGYYDGRDAAGTAGGTAQNPGDSITGANLTPGASGENYDFGELRPASIEGLVYADANDNGVPDPGEAPIGGVTLHLIDSTGRRVAEATTDANGRYVFRNLAPGTYGVDEDQPAGYFDGKERVGTAGGVLDGNDRIRQVKLMPGAAGRQYDFGELPPAKISGYVYQDGPAITYDYGSVPPDPHLVRDGRLTPDDTRLAGVRLILADEFGRPILDGNGQPRVAVTDANGYYEFDGLAPGTYTILESQPQGYADGNDLAGSVGGLAVNPSLSAEQMEAVRGVLAVDPNDDAIVWIPLMPGDNAVSYNFSEARVQEQPLVPPPEPPKPPEPLPHLLPQPFTEERPYLFLPGEGTPLPMLVPLYGGVGIPPAYTWHLSVVNAGRPRRDGEGNDETAFVPAAWVSASAWAGADINQGKWILVDADGNPLRTFQFGVLGATPVTGDFNGDGVTEIGAYSRGTWFVDLNGNGRWDEQDLWAKLGAQGDKPVTGDWDGDGKSDIGIFGPQWSGDPRAMSYEPGLPDAANRRPPQVAGRFKNIPPDPHQATSGLRALRRTAIGKLRKDLIDHVFQYGSEIDKPVSGDWNGDGVSNIGVFREGTWYLDVDGDGRWSDGDQVVEYGRPGDIPVVGDWNGDGTDKLGVYRQGTFYLDVNGDRVLDDRDKVIKVGGPGDVPVVGDWNGDGADEVGVYQPAPQEAQPPAASEPAPEE